MRNKLINLLFKIAEEKDCPQPHEVADYLLENGVIVLPVAVGVNVWCLAQPCGGCSCYNEPMKEEFVEVCRNCDKWEIIECDFDYELISEFGKTVFPTKEEAEQALGKLQASYEQVEEGVE